MIIQIVLLDIVFSLDSVITAVGMISDQYGEYGIWIMIAAVVISIIAMMAFAGPIGDFVQRHPTIKMHALSFLLLIGVMRSRRLHRRYRRATLFAWHLGRRRDPEHASAKAIEEAVDFTICIMTRKQPARVMLPG